MEDSSVFDQILVKVGDNGKFQKRFRFFFNFLFVSICILPYLTFMLSLVIPGHWCYVPGRNATNYTLAEWKELHIPRINDTNDVVKYSSCEMYNIPLSDTSHDFKGIPNITACKYGYEYDKTWFEVTIPTTNDWVCDKSHYVNNLLAFGAIGDVCGSFVLGQVADHFGRRPVFLISLVMAFVGRMSMLLASSNFYLFMAVAFIGSFPSFSALSSTLIISLETTSPERRTFVTQIQTYSQLFGQILLPLIYWAFPNWKTFTLICVLPSAVFILSYWSIIESPRWLASKGKIDECMEVFRRIAKVNGTNLDQEIVDQLQMETKKTETVYGFMSTFSSWRLAKNNLICIFCTVVLGINTVTIFLNTTNMGGNPFIILISQTVVEVPGLLLGKYLCDKIGRRASGSSAYLLTALMFVCVIITFNYKDFTIVTNAFLIFSKLSMSAAYYSILMQKMEIYPTCVRQTGMSLGAVMSGIFTIFVPYIVHLGRMFDARYPFCVLSAICMTAAVLQLFLPETLHAKLPETLQEARVFGKDQKFFSLPINPKDIKISKEEIAFIEK